jgi:hypothetical protein
MGWLRSRLFVVWAAIGLLAAADSVGVALVAIDTAPAPDLVATGTTTTTAGPTDDTTTTAVPAIPVTTLAAPPTTAASTRPPAPGGVVVPRAGTYRNHVKDDTTTGSQHEADEYDEDLNIVDLGGGRQRHRTLEDGEVYNVDEVLWRADGRFVAVSMDDDTPSSGDCNWEPDLRTLALPAKPGMTWAFKSSCTVVDEEDPEPYSFTLSGTGRVIGNDRTTVGGAAVDVVKIHFDFIDETAGPGETFTVDELYAPSLALTVEEMQKTTGTDEDDDGKEVPYTDVEVRRLQSVNPA